MEILVITQEMMTVTDTLPIEKMGTMYICSS